MPLYGATRERRSRSWLLGPFVAFFGTGYFSGFGAVTAEIFPTAIRATAQGVTYNIGRGLSALAPITVGALAVRYGLGAAFSITSGAFVLAAVLWIWIPGDEGAQPIYALTVETTCSLVPALRTQADLDAIAHRRGRLPPLVQE